MVTVAAGSRVGWLGELHCVIHIFTMSFRLHELPPRTLLQKRELGRGRGCPQIEKTLKELTLPQ